MTHFDENKPIFLQVKERIEDQIVNDQLKDEEQIPSTTQLVQIYKINHLTISKGINLLVEKGVIFKKRGVGMFVAAGAKQKLLEERKETFMDEYVLPMLEEADKLGISRGELESMLKGRKNDEF
ncbi:GntR family transcriptional regulator [Salimicrobium flavidum]|uniref:Transcriptional regulator, GntR family n=1 Tax=Salimicrobium flavidum TaxID=570947 RepID=A0A1N7JE65_9BACI|nr:GntR family transcriptional regulator [Salimicrobium flavidum]SIS47663.1 transcriptional regulator, GntR family [Salimicrobium flavidum]